jgi:hypothetical protein
MYHKQALYVGRMAWAGLTAAPGATPGLFTGSAGFALQTVRLEFAAFSVKSMRHEDWGPRY